MSRPARLALSRPRSIAADCLAAWLAALGANALGGAEESPCRVEITVLDKLTGRPLPSRIGLDNASGEPDRSEGQLLWRDQLVCVSDGIARLPLPAGRYTFEVEHGHEYFPVRGMVNVLPGDAEKKLTITLERMADLAGERWWSGDLHVHHPLEFFRDWAVERSEQLRRLGDCLQRQELLEQWDRAKKFWEERVAEANAP
jgi:hypothetical protein